MLQVIKGEGKGAWRTLKRHYFVLVCIIGTHYQFCAGVNYNGNEINISETRYKRFINTVTVRYRHKINQKYLCYKLLYRKQKQQNTIRNGPNIEDRK